MPILTPRADGLVESATPVLLPVMAPRLQGELSAAGFGDLALWGEGDLGRIRFEPLAGPYVYGPNILTTPGGGIFVAQEAPVMAIRGATPDIRAKVVKLVVSSDEAERPPTSTSPGRPPPPSVYQTTGSFQCSANSRIWSVFLCPKWPWVPASTV